jgi:succinate dehydrogenase / fumarate reductase cytochrome b subunit
MLWFIKLFRSQIGKKAVMAVSGIGLFGFVFIHMFGNLKVYLGAESFNHYAEWLREVGYPLLPHSGVLWIFRFGLLALVTLHVLAAWQVTRVSWKARPKSYKDWQPQASDYASRTMRWGGVIIALFVVYHLAHFTWGWSWVHPDFVAGDPYHNFVAGFSVWWVSSIYIVAQLALGLHLYHGLWSIFQTLGWTNPRFNSWRRRFAQTFAVVTVAGNISFPLSVMAGWVQ